MMEHATNLGNVTNLGYRLSQHSANIVLALNNPTSWQQKYCNSVSTSRYV